MSTVTTVSNSHNVQKQFMLVRELYCSWVNWPQWKMPSYRLEKKWCCLVTMHFRNVNRSFTRHSRKCIDKGQRAIILRSQLLHPFNIPFINVSVVINSFFLYFWRNVSHLIFASCYVRETYCSRLFLYREILEINVSRKFHLIRPRVR